MKYNTIANQFPQQIGPIQVDGLSQLLSESSHRWHPDVKKYEVYESPEDLLALSVAWKRLRDAGGIMPVINNLIDKDLYSHVTNDDRQLANTIRDFYSKKIMMWKLKNISEFSHYRKDLNSFVHSNGLTFNENMLGLAYHLPAFYDYDIVLDSVKSEVNPHQEFKKLDTQMKPKVLTLSTNLIPLKKLEKKRKKIHNIQYWFKDDTINAAVCITVEKNNTLLHVWDQIFDNQKVLKIKGRYVRRTLDDFEYFSVDRWELDKG